MADALLVIILVCIAGLAWTYCAQRLADSIPTTVAFGLNIAYAQQQIKDYRELTEWEYAQQEARFDYLTRKVDGLSGELTRLRDSLHGNNANHR